MNDLCLDFIQFYNNGGEVPESCSKPNKNLERAARGSPRMMLKNREEPRTRAV